MAPEFERLAYDTALRALDMQEELLRELRTRTGVLLAAASLAASFLGSDAFQDPSSVALVVLALLAFVISIGASVYILTPKEALTFSQSGSGLYEGLYEHRDDLPEVYRRLAYDLDRFWESNDEGIARLFLAFRVAAVALGLEILFLVGLVSGNIL
jgi:hypothetical protein